MKSPENISRRHLIKGAAIAAGAGLVAGCAGFSSDKATASKPKRTSDKPNILIITCDQLAWDGIKANGNADTHTPAIDSIIASGTSFDAAYTPYPLCSPARASYWTGYLPHQHEVQGNYSENIPMGMQTMGTVFSRAGYITKHYGKTHDFGSLRGFDIARNMGLDVNGTEAYPVHAQTRSDQYTMKRAIEFLERDHTEPFVAAVEFHNPHNINNWIGEFAGPHGDIPGMEVLPPLRPNHDNPDLENRPLSIQYMCCNFNRQSQVSQWSETNYQQYLKAYYHYTGLGDNCVAKVLEALQKSDVADNTLVVFFSDHGDGMGSHKLVAKASYFYEEGVKVPFVLSGPGIPSGVRNQQLASLCDLLPTLCDYAGIEKPDNIYGKSLLPALTGNNVEGRTSVVSQWYTLRDATIQPARMLRFEDYKYTHYIEDGGEELYDLKADRYERRNLVNDPQYSQILDRARIEFKTYLEETNDPFLSLTASVDERWRSHEVGYENHQGGGAQQAIWS